MVFGALLPCEECSGQLVFRSDAYYCTGDVTAWTKCMVKTQTPSRKDWVTPKEFREISYLKKLKTKKQDRIFPPETSAPAAGAPPPSTASAPASMNSSAPPGTAGGGGWGPDLSERTVSLWVLCLPILWGRPAGLPTAGGRCLGGVLRKAQWAVPRTPFRMSSCPPSRPCFPASWQPYPHRAS